MNKKFIAISLLIFCSISHAGFNGLTIHSRNNCGNNESITWDATKKHRLGTNSSHFYKDGTSHKFGSGIETTNRSAAVHWGEGIGGWIAVAGEHYLLNSSNKITWVKATYVVDCSIYDGWWDWNP